MSRPTDATKPEAKMPKQKIATPIVTIHLRLKRSAVSPANGTQRPYIIAKTVPTTPIDTLSTPSEVQIAGMEGPNNCRVPCWRKNATQRRMRAVHL